MLSKLSIKDLRNLIFDSKGERNQEILDETILRFKNSQIQFNELRDMIGLMRNIDTLKINFSLQYDKPEIRDFLFSELRGRLTSRGLSFWSGYPEARDPYMKDLIQDLSKDLEKSIFQERIIDSLIKVYFLSPLRNRIEDIAGNFFGFPIDSTDRIAQRIKSEIQMIIDSGQEQSSGYTTTTTMSG